MDATAGNHSSETETNEFLAAEFVLAWYSRERDRILSFYHPEYRGQETSTPQEHWGSIGVSALIDRFFNAFPDLNISLNHLVCQGERLALFWTATGTHRGSIMHIPPTNKRISVSGASYITVRDGKVYRGKHLWDMAAMLRSMGLLPELR